MTNKNLSEIVLVVDRSGSMETIKDDAEGGINSFIRDQKNAPGDANLTLCQFDTDYEFVHKGEKIENVPEFTLVPRGMTALNDAIGRAINETGDRLAALPEDERPALIMFMVVTDGCENASQEFHGPKIKEMIEHQRDKYNWNFSFLGTEESSIGVAQNLGFQNVSQYKGDNSSKVYASMGGKFSLARAASASGMSCVEAYAMNSISKEDSESFLE